MGKFLLMVLTVSFLGLDLQGADITWSLPERITDSGDVVTLGKLDRAYNMGEPALSANILGVTFMPFAGSGLESITNDRTVLAVSSEFDRVESSENGFGSELSRISANYKNLLKSGVFDFGSPLALTLHGLSVGENYLIQFWVNDSRALARSEILTGGALNSSPLQYNATGTNGGMGYYIIGVFTADSESETITCTPVGGACQINAFQLRSGIKLDTGKIFKQPSSVENYVGKSAFLSVSAMGNVNYRWQKVTSDATNDLTDIRVSGVTNNRLEFNTLAANDSGRYRAILTSSRGSVTSSIVSVIALPVPTNRLINVATVAGLGAGIRGHSCDAWNCINGTDGVGLSNLVDSTGVSTPVSIKVLGVGAVAGNGVNGNESLLGAYKYANSQRVILNNLEPNELYDLIVYSIGNNPHEGGVFSGAIGGVSCGSQDSASSGSSKGTNYVENPCASADANGTLAFTIFPNPESFNEWNPICIFNGLQIQKLSPQRRRPAITAEPASAVCYKGRPAILSVNAVPPPSSYRWQKITEHGTEDLIDNGGISGSTQNALIFGALNETHAGNYRVIATYASGSLTSSIASMTVLASPTSQQLINVDINDGKSTTYSGAAVLGESSNVWNGINGKLGFSRAPLKDSSGALTSVALTLKKRDGGAFTSLGNNLLKDYSYSSKAQEVTFDHLEPNSVYDLVVYCIGSGPREGGVVSGGINGVAHGYPNQTPALKEFTEGVSYVRNSSALSDANGLLTFSIAPTITAVTGGNEMGDFNGVQISKIATAQPPMIVSGPSSATNFDERAFSLSVYAGPSAWYHWQKITTNGPVDLTDEASLSGSKRNTLVFDSLSVNDAGDYRVIVANEWGSITSGIARLTVVSPLLAPSSNPLLNFAIKNGNYPIHAGNTVFGTSSDVWNEFSGKDGFQRVRLLDSSGAPTLVTLSMVKRDGDAFGFSRNELLKDYSFSSMSQIITFDNLEPNAAYDLVVYCIGCGPFEGGVLSGAITGVARGYPSQTDTLAEYTEGINYVRNHSAFSDSKGSLSFSIEPTATAFPEGNKMGDFNGLQLLQIGSKKSTQ